MEFYRLPASGPAICKHTLHRLIETFTALYLVPGFQGILTSLQEELLALGKTQEIAAVENQDCGFSIDVDFSSTSL